MGGDVDRTGCIEGFQERQQRQRQFSRLRSERPVVKGRGAGPTENEATVQYGTLLASRENHNEPNKERGGANPRTKII